MKNSHSWATTTACTIGEGNDWPDGLFVIGNEAYAVPKNFLHVTQVEGLGIGKKSPQNGQCAQSL